MVGKLSKPVNFLIISEDLCNFTSCASVGAMNNYSPLAWFESWNDLIKNLMLALESFVIELKQSLKMLSRCNGSVTDTP